MPQEIICAVSGEHFTIEDDELALYQNLGVPLPTLSPNERWRRILAHRNERVLYKRKCSATEEQIISIHSEQAPFPVFSQSYWWSDGWDSLHYARDYDFSKGFFEQFLELYNVVPQIALNTPNSENSEWTNQTTHLKNCYMLICGGYSQDCMYGMLNTYCENCFDCGAAFRCTLCYECFHSDSSFQCRYCDNLEQCSDCTFCRELIGCQDCIAYC
ncbi:hypothetical protein OAO01_06845 [Oligoflexia bacterium]|nr:hypothetical protein [Oligoflexia bacterium]